VLGSDDKLWVMIAGSHWFEPNTYDERYRGRVKRLGGLPFYDHLVSDLRTMTPVPRFVSLSTVREHLGESPESTVRDLAGDAIAVSGSTPVTVSERVAGRAHVTGFDVEDLHDEAAWREALTAAGVLAPGAVAQQSSLKSWTFTTDAPSGVAALDAKLVGAKLYAARAEPVDVDHQTTWARLADSGSALQLRSDQGSVDIPYASIRTVALQVPRTAPVNARVIVTTDRPDDYWYVLPLYFVFGAFALLFGWALWRSLGFMTRDKAP